MEQIFLKFFYEDRVQQCSNKIGHFSGRSAVTGGRDCVQKSNGNFSGLFAVTSDRVYVGTPYGSCLGRYVVTILICVMPELVTFNLFLSGVAPAGPAITVLMLLTFSVTFSPTASFTATIAVGHHVGSLLCLPSGLSTGGTWTGTVHGFCEFLNSLPGTLWCSVLCVCAFSDLRLTCATTLIGSRANNCQSFIRLGSGACVTESMSVLTDPATYGLLNSELTNCPRTAAVLGDLSAQWQHVMGTLQRVEQETVPSQNLAFAIETLSKTRNRCDRKPTAIEGRRTTLPEELVAGIIFIFNRLVAVRKIA